MAALIVLHYKTWIFFYKMVAEKSIVLLRDDLHEFLA